VQLRKNAGFPTAYKFYHDNGGQAGLKISYRNYLLIEQGKKLPMFERLGTFTWALRLLSKTAKANELVAAWLKTMAGEENYKQLIEPLLAFKPEVTGFSPMQKAMKKAIDASKYPLSVKQLQAVFAAPDNYLAYLAITHDSGAWPKKDLAARLKFKEAAVGKAMKALVRVKLVKEIKPGVYKCPLAGAVLEYPVLNSLPQDLQKKIYEYSEKLQAGGLQTFLCQTVIRVDELDFKSYLPIAEANISASSSYAITEKTEHSALVMVEGKITKLRDF
jgi:DNA-binding Lrp family transcriptional regulator